MKILFLTQLFPYPPICGGTILSWNVLRHLGAQHDVTLVCFVRKEPVKEQMDAVKSLCKDIHTVFIKRSTAANIKSAAESLISNVPFIVGRDYVPDMQSTVSRLLNSRQFDLIYIDHLQMAQYTANWDRCPKVLSEHNVEWKIIERIAEAERFSPKGLFAKIEWKKLRKWELDNCTKFDMVFTVSENDKRTLENANPKLSNVVHIPIGVDFNSFSKTELSPLAQNIVSIGTMSWPPNIDSIHYFVRDIYPAVKARTNGVKLVVTGSSPPESIRKLSEQDSTIEITGFVEDLTAIAASAAVFIVPLRSGSGMRVKIINAMAMGLPIVSTSIGCEGIDVCHDQHLLIADNSNDFADAIIRLMNDFGLRKRLAEAGRDFAMKNYSWDSIYARLDQALDSLVSESRNVYWPSRRRYSPPPVWIKSK
jgi:glycosyltransferase involved in cell wall biosynthesis